MRKIMQSLRSTSLIGRRLRCSLSNPASRNLTSLRNTALIDETDNDVLVKGNAYSRTAILNRPSVLNALSTAMNTVMHSSIVTHASFEQSNVRFIYLKVTRLHELYKSWEDNPDVGFVVLKGSGSAFCAGGDILYLYHLTNDGNIEDCKHFIRTLSSFIYLLGTYLKPHVAKVLGEGRFGDFSIVYNLASLEGEELPYFRWPGDVCSPLKGPVAILNGVTMGGGAGISIPGTFKLATNKTVFSMPETLIGFHPDGGASFYLSRLPGHLGEYLALTGDKLNGAEMIACGLATHYSLIERLPLVEEQLGKLVTDDPSVVETSLGKFSDIVYPDTTSVFRRLATVDKCFCKDTIEEIMDALEVSENWKLISPAGDLKDLTLNFQENEAAETHDEWCISTLKTLRYASPLSLKVSLRSIREGRFQSLDQCLVREYRMACQTLSKQISNDFCEGVRARIVDKDSAPKWNPPSLEHVSVDMVDQYFSPLSEFEPDLELPTKQREAFT